MTSCCIMRKKAQVDRPSYKGIASQGDSYAMQYYTLPCEGMGISTLQRILIHLLSRRLSQLIKQTYSVFVDSPKNSRKWHINAYYTQDTLDQLNTVDQIPQLKSIQVPAGLYVCARTNTARRMSRILARPSAERRSSDTTSSSSSRGLDVPPSTQSIAVGSLPLPFPGAAGFNTPAPYARQLAPLEYLQNIPPQARDPIDDEVLRSFPSNF
ncbi:hypothetical protein AcW1_008708 [Taiwanofungus camphoratus]|nr:hypothetical protein AcW1_008708 [Antrodia cinnamomea]